MNIKSLITTLVIGSSSIAVSSVAMADPSLNIDARVSWRAPGVEIRDHRIETPAPITYVRPTYIAPVAPLPKPPGYSWGNQGHDYDDDDQDGQYSGGQYGGGWDGGGQYGGGWDGGWNNGAWRVLSPAVRIGGFQPFTMNARVRWIALQPVSGSSNIKRVGIVYANGQREVVELHRQLASNTGMITLPVNARLGAVRQVQVYGQGRGRGLSLRVLGA